MATKVLKSVKGRRFRLTKLDACGVPVVGSCSTVVSSGFVQVVLSGEREDGAEITQRNAWGDACISDKDAGYFKWVNTTVNLCEVDPTVVDIMGGEAITPLLSGADTIGFAVNTEANLQAYALEVWTKQAGQDACAGGTTNWGYFVVPFIKNGRIDGDITIEASNAVTLSMTGEGQPAVAAWGTTPYVGAGIANPLLHTGGMPVGNLWAQVVTTIQPPAVTAGCVALA